MSLTSGQVSSYLGGIPVYFALSRVEYAVFAGNFEAFYITNIRNEAESDILESYAHRAVVGFRH